MATEILACSSTSTPNNWIVTANANKVDAVASPDDDASSYIISSPIANKQQQYFLNDPVSIESGDSITNVAIRARCRSSSSTLTADYKVTAVLSSSSLDGTTRTAPLSGSGYATTIDDFPTKPGGGPWTLSDVQNLQIRIENTQARSVDCTTFEVIVTYEKSSPITVDPDVAQIDVTAHGPTPSPGPVTESTSAALVDVAAHSATPVPGEVSLGPGVALANVIAHSATPVPGGVSLTAGEALANTSAHSPSVSVGPVATTAGSAQFYVTADSATILVGPVSVSANAAFVNATSHFPSVAIGTISATAGYAALSMFAISPSVEAGEAIVDAGVANVFVLVSHSNPNEPLEVDAGVANVFIATLAAAYSPQYQETPPNLPANPNPPTVSPPEYKHVFFPGFVDVSFPWAGVTSNNGDSCISVATAKVPLKLFDFSKEDGNREGIDYNRIILALDPSTGGSGFPPTIDAIDGGEQSIDDLDSLYPYYSRVSPTQISSSAGVATNYRVNRLNNTDKARDLAIRIAKDYYGWRLEGSDDYYVGTPYYLFDAHDDTILFDYSVTNGVGMRVCPVPFGFSEASSILNASELNCWREVERFYVGPLCTHAIESEIESESGGGGTRTDKYIINRWQERPLYADGRFGHVCKQWYDCTVNTDICPGTEFCVHVYIQTCTSDWREYCTDSPIYGYNSPVSGKHIAILTNDKSSVVAAASTGECGDVCFVIPGGEYTIRIQHCPGLTLDYCSQIVTDCEKSIAVINDCFAQSILRVIDYDTGELLPVTVGYGIDENYDCHEYNPYIENPLRTANNGEPVWVRHTSKCSVRPVGFLAKRILEEEYENYLPPNEQFGTFSPMGYFGEYMCSHNAALYQIGDQLYWMPLITGRSPEPYKDECGADECCGSRTYTIALFNNKKWVPGFLYQGCEKTIDVCDRSGRSGRMWPRKLYARFRGPEPITGTTDSIELTYIGTAVNPWNKCVQTWDSGCIPGLGKYECIEYKYTDPCWSNSRCILSTEEKRYPFARVMFKLTGFGHGDDTYATLSVINFFSREACEAFEARGPAGTGCGEIDMYQAFLGRPEDCYDTGRFLPCYERENRVFKEPRPIEVPGVSALGHKCGRLPDIRCGEPIPPFQPILGRYYPAGFYASGFMRHGCTDPYAFCVTPEDIPDPNERCGNCSTPGSYCLNRPLNISWRFTSRWGCPLNSDPCEWVVDYEVFE